MKATHGLPTWELRKVERQHWTLKNTLAKLCQDAGINWLMLIPVTLLQSWCIQYWDGLTPSELVFRRPSPLVPALEGFQDIGMLDLCQQMKVLDRTLEDLQQTVLQNQPFHFIHQWILLSLEIKLYWIVKRGNPKTKVGGPQEVVLTMPSALKLSGCTQWIHHYRGKK